MYPVLIVIRPIGGASPVDLDSKTFVEDGAARWSHASDYRAAPSIKPVNVIQGLSGSRVTFGGRPSHIALRSPY